MKTRKDYHDVYLKCEGLILADVFEKLRNNSLKNYKLFPGNYLSAAGLSWDAMLKVTKTELGLIPDPNIYMKKVKRYMWKRYKWWDFFIFLIDIGKPTINI